MKEWTACVRCNRLRSSCVDGVCAECRFKAEGGVLVLPRDREQLIQQNNTPLERRRRWFKRDRH